MKNQSNELRFGITPVYKALEKCKNEKLILLQGGAGSGKSYAVSQYWIFNKMLQETGKTLVVSRKTNPSLRFSAMLEIENRLREARIPCLPDKTHQTIQVHGNIIIFKSLDDPNKLTSINAHYWWLEEGTELDLETYVMVKMRCRNENRDSRNQIILSFNPISKYNYIKTKIIDGKGGYALILSSWRDNPYLTDDYIRDIQGLKEYAPHMWEVFSENKWGMTQGVIYPKWITKEFPRDLEGYEHFYGMDFGATNPSAIVEVAKKNENLFIREICYERNMSNEDIIEKMRGERMDVNANIWADPAEPDRIKKIADGGFNIRGARKNVLDGIIAVKSHKIYIDPQSENLKNEIAGYGWREVRGITLDEPVKKNDHLMDALRYAVYSEQEEVLPGIGSIKLGRRR